MYKHGMPAGTMESGEFSICISTMVYHFRSYGTLVSYATNAYANTIIIGKCLMIKTLLSLHENVINEFCRFFC
jgi:hypothetical protein